MLSENPLEMDARMFRAMDQWRINSGLDPVFAGLSPDDMQRLGQLPAPVREELSRTADQFLEMFPGQAAKDMLALFSDPDLDIERCYNRLALAHPHVIQVMIDLGILGQQASGKNLGVLDATIMPFRYRLQGGTLFQLTDELNMALENTGIAEDTPMAYFKAPYPSIYIRFGESPCSNIALQNQQSGRHVLEGAYVFEVSVTPHDREGASLEKAERLGIDVTQPYRVIDLLFIGSPAGKRNFSDDTTLNISLLAQDPEETVGAMFERHIAHYAISHDDDTPWFGGLAEEDVSEYQAAVGHVAKALLFLNSSSVRKALRRDRSEAEQALSKLRSASKIRKAKRRALRLYDYVEVTPGVSIREAQGPEAGTRAVATHWRRGHLRQQSYGPRRTQRRLIWIAPTIVKADRALEGSRKPYKAGV